MVPGPRSEAGQWFLLRLLIDPTTGPTNHALGTVFHAGVARDYRDLTPRRSLEEAGAPEMLPAGGAALDRIEWLRGQGRVPLVRVVQLRDDKIRLRWQEQKLRAWCLEALDLVVGGGPAPVRPVELVAVSEWGLAEYLRIRAAEPVRLPTDVACVVFQVAPSVAGLDLGGSNLSGRLDGLGVLPFVSAGRSYVEVSSGSRLGVFDPNPVVVVVVRGQPSHSQLRPGLVVGVGRASLSSAVGRLVERRLDVASDDEEVVALRRHLLHRVLLEPRFESGPTAFLLSPDPRDASG